MHNCAYIHKLYIRRYVRNKSCVVTPQYVTATSNMDIPYMYMYIYMYSCTPYHGHTICAHVMYTLNLQSPRVSTHFSARGVNVQMDFSK